MVKCNRCGRCCYVYDEFGKHKCRHLVILSNGKTLCRIYKTRLGTLTGYKNAKCFEREKVLKNYTNCEFNREEYGDAEDVKWKK